MWTRFLLAVALATLASAQGSRADYERAATIGARARGAVQGMQAQVTWSPDGQRAAWLVLDGPTWTSVQAVQLATAEERTVVTREGLRRFCADNGIPLPDLRSLRFLPSGELALLVLGGRDPKTLLAGGDGLRLGGAEHLKVFGLPTESRRASRDRGGDTEVLFVNNDDVAHDVVWVGRDGAPQRYGRLAPGDALRQHTFVGHAWEFGAPGRVHVAVAGGGVAFPATVETDPKAVEPPRAREPGPPAPSFRVRPRRVEFKASDGEPARTVSLPDSIGEGRLVAGRAWTSPGATRALVPLGREGGPRQIQLIEAAPGDRLQPRIHRRSYDKPGDPRWIQGLVLVGPGAVTPLQDARLDDIWSVDQCEWLDEETFVFRVNTRGHQALRYLQLDARTGELRTLIEETSPTFLDYSQKGYCRRIGDHVLWMSERSGTNHLYRYSIESGALLNPVTRGDWVLRAVDEVNLDAGWIRFRAMGVYPDQDPYHVHHGRVNLDGTGLVWLTEADGTHELRFSPDGEHYVASWSRVDHPPVHELRRSRDGSLVSEVARADASGLEALGLSMPLRFHAPGRDGETPIWGILHRPSKFDPGKTYPVIEAIYAGPHGAHVPKGFRPAHGPQALCELGFVVVQIDGMGTNWRHKAFHDVCWKNLKDAGFPDRIAWLRAAGEEYPWLDLDRVGIYGGSAGGQNAMRAVLDHHDVYRAAVADCGCHDNRMDKVWWNEAWMGWPVDDSYAASSNAVDAHRLGAPLLLTVGAMDDNVDPSSTMQVVDALIEADRDFDLIVFPSGRHGAIGHPYGQRRMRDFFVRHLLGVEPRWE